MSNTPLTQREFDTWRETDEQFKNQMLGFCRTQTELNLRIEGRMSTIESKQEDTDATIKRRTGLITALASAIATIATAFGAWFANRS